LDSRLPVSSPSHLLAFPPSRPLAFLNREFWNSEVQECRNSGIQEFKNSGIQEFRNSGIQEFRQEPGKAGMRALNS
jgi:hypothetical protein